MTELSDAERIHLIRKALVDCKQEPTALAIFTQFHRETGRTYAIGAKLPKPDPDPVPPGTDGEAA